jgi:hypothetical protein
LQKQKAKGLTEWRKDVPATKPQSPFDLTPTSSKPPRSSPGLTVSTSRWTGPFNNPHLSIFFVIPPSYQVLVAESNEVVGKLFDDVGSVSGLVLGAVVSNNDGLVGLDNGDTVLALREEKGRQAQDNK